jgi:hypothetical protein
MPLCGAVIYDITCAVFMTARYNMAGSLDFAG